MSAVADDLEQTIAGIRLALQAVNAPAHVPDAPAARERLPDPADARPPAAPLARTGARGSSRTRASTEQDELERDIERLRQEKQRLERDIAQTEQRNRQQTGRDAVSDDDPDDGPGMLMRASAPRVTRAAGPPPRPRGPEQSGGEQADRVSLSSLGNSVTKEIVPEPHRHPAMAPVWAPDWGRVDEQKMYQQRGANGQENENQLQRHRRPTQRAAPPAPEDLDPGDRDLRSYASVPPELARHARGMLDNAAPAPLSLYNNRKLPPPPVPLQRPQRSQARPQRSSARPAIGHTWNAGGAPDSAPEDHAWPDQAANVQRTTKGIWQLVPDSAPEVAEFSDYHNYTVSNAGMAEDPGSSGHDAEMVYSDYGGTYSLKDLETPPKPPKKTRFQEDDVRFAQGLQDDTRNRDRVSPKSSPTKSSPNAPTLLQRPDDKSQNEQSGLMRSHRRSLRAAAAPNTAAPLQVEQPLAEHSREQLKSDSSMPTREGKAPAEAHSSINAPASSEDTLLFPASCESLFSPAISDDLPVVDQAGAMWNHGTLTHVQREAFDHVERLEQPVGILRTEDTDEDLAGEGDRLALEIQRRMVEAARMKRDNFLIPNVPDSPSDHQLRGSGRFSMAPALARVEESMEEEEEKEEASVGDHFLAPATDPQDDLIEQYLRLSPPTTPNTVDTHQPQKPGVGEAAASVVQAVAAVPRVQRAAAPPPSRPAKTEQDAKPDVGEAAAPVVQAVAAVPRVQRAAAPPPPSRPAKTEQDAKPLQAEPKLPARPAGIPADYMPSPHPGLVAHHLEPQVHPTPENSKGQTSSRLLASQALDSSHQADPPSIAAHVGEDTPVQPPSASTSEEQLRDVGKSPGSADDSAPMREEHHHGAVGAPPTTNAPPIDHLPVVDQADTMWNHGTVTVLVASHVMPANEASDDEVVPVMRGEEGQGQPGNWVPSSAVSKVMSVAIAEDDVHSSALSPETVPVHRSPPTAMLPPRQEHAEAELPQEVPTGGTPPHSILTRVEEDRSRTGGWIGPSPVAYFPPPDNDTGLSFPPQTQPAITPPQNSPTMAAQWQPPRPVLSPPPSQPMSAPANAAVNEALARQIAANQLVVEEDSDDDSVWSATPRPERAPIGHSRSPEDARAVPVSHTSAEGVNADGEAGAPVPPVLLDEEITDDLFLKAMGFNDNKNKGEPQSHFAAAGPKKRVPAFTVTSRVPPPANPPLRKSAGALPDVLGNLFGMGAAKTSDAGRVQSASNVEVHF